MDKKKALKWLLIFIGAELLAVAAFVMVFDPFYQYHGPIGGMKGVLYDTDNQVAGTVRNFSYDTILLGSSEANNFDTDYLDGHFRAKTLKVIHEGTNISDMLYYLDMVRRHQEVGRVFWDMDLFALNSWVGVSFNRKTAPFYLHTESILDDVPYLFNKEVIFVKIPYMLAKEKTGGTGGLAYGWSVHFSFGTQAALASYEKPEQPTLAQRQADASDPVRVKPSEVPFLEENTANVLAEINSHPETDYIIFFPPYSMLWWDDRYVNGQLESYLTTVETVLPALLSCENVSVYFFQDDRDIICDLDNYMDQAHYSPKINQYMLESIEAGRGRVTRDNVDEVIASMRSTCEYIITEGIFNYYPGE